MKDCIHADLLEQTGECGSRCPNCNGDLCMHTYDELLECKSIIKKKPTTKYTRGNA